jgi:hypothetical protein
MVERGRSYAIGRGGRFSSSVMTDASRRAISSLHTLNTLAGGVTPNRLRRERQVASALRNRTDFMIASFYCGAAGTAGHASAEARPRVRPPRRPAKGLR